MATVTYKTSIETAQAAFRAAADELTAKTSALEGNIKSLNDMAARPYADIKDQLKVLNQQMLDYYSKDLPTITATREKGMKAIAEIQQQLVVLNELPDLSQSAIEHLTRLGCKTIETIQAKQTERAKGRVELEGNIRSLYEAIAKVDGLHKPFYLAIENALGVQAKGDGTAGFFDGVLGTATYVYLNRELTARNAPKPLAPAIVVEEPAK